MWPKLRQLLRQLRLTLAEPPSPRLADENQWYTEHTALLVSTLKWAMLGAGAGVCVGLGTRAFLWSISASGAFLAGQVAGRVPLYFALPLALPLCVWLIRTFSPEARGHGTEAVIAAIHQRSGRIDWLVAPVKLVATVITLAFGGSVGKEGPAAQIGAAITSLFADLTRLNDADRRRLVICGISAGFAAVFGTPVSGALFGIEVLYLGRIDYTVIFPALVAGIVGHLVCGVAPPFPLLNGAVGDHTQIRMILTSLASGAIFGLVALLLIETLRAVEHRLQRFASHPYRVAFGGGCALVLLYFAAGDRFAGLGTETIAGVLNGTIPVGSTDFLVKILATAITLEVGGSGGILTPVFFIGVTSGAALAPVFGVSAALLGAFGFIAVLAAAANTPLAAAVMAIEIFPAPLGVLAALAAATAYLMVGHRSVYASQKLGFSKSAGLDMALGGDIGEFNRAAIKVRPGSFTARLHNLGRPRPRDDADSGADS
ncbi:MAG: chloride channel protein [Gemmatimonadota bacterium]